MSGKFIHLKVTSTRDGKSNISHFLKLKCLLKYRPNRSYRRRNLDMHIDSFSAYKYRFQSQIKGMIISHCMHT